MATAKLAKPTSFSSAIDSTSQYDQDIAKGHSVCGLRSINRCAARMPFEPLLIECLAGHVGSFHMGVDLNETTDRNQSKRTIEGVLNPSLPRAASKHT